MTRYKLTLEYDGTRYSGWQIQKNAKTVQGMLITAAKDAFGEVGEVMGSGRTDAGVHALMQVAHIDLKQQIESYKIVYGLNDKLPSDITVLSAVQTPKTFHARRDATGRSYLYQISSRRTAFTKNAVWWIKDPLDLGAMRRAVPSLLGMHDFRGFAEALPDETSTKVLVNSVEIAEHGELLLVRIRASHFLHKMVRRVVGTLVEIGRGNTSPDVIADVLDNPNSKSTGISRFTAPPSGLFLEQVIYKEESYLAKLVPAWQIMFSYQ